MKEEKEDFVSAGYVYYAEWVPLDNIAVEDPRNPETILLEKDRLQRLPKKCKTLVEILMSLPDEMFMLNGKVKKTALHRIINEKTGWSKERIERIELKLRESLEKV
jgi:hypothetical protein